MNRLNRLDRRLFALVAASRVPGVDSVLPRLSQAANHGRLWMGAAAALAGPGGPTARRAAGRGLASLALASATTNTLIKYATRRPRPLIDAVPFARRPTRLPLSYSFPSGHSASAAAFAAGVALESTRYGLLIAPVAGAVAFSRVYVGVHFPSDVLAGCTLGACAALLTTLWWPPRPEPARLVHRQAKAPALAGGEGLVVVVNESAGPGGGGQLAPSTADRLRTLLPLAEVIEPGERDLGEVLDEAADLAAGRGGALGVCGGDGSASAAAGRAAERGLPLAVFPGGTLNRFALDTGTESLEDAARAVHQGEAIAVDLGRARPADGPGQVRYFLNNLGVGLYPDLVHQRERLERRIGKWPAAAVSLARVLRTSPPLTPEIDGRPTPLWMLFAGNGRYSPEGFAPAHRTRLDDGLLDVRTVAAGKPLARTRVVLSALTGTLARSRVYTATRQPGLRLSGLDEVAAVAYDGETAPAPGALLIDKWHGRLTVYRPATD